MYCVPAEQAEPKTEVGLRLRHLREARGLSPSQLAGKAGLTQPTIWRIETGDTQNPGVGTLALIAEALDVHVSALTGEGAELERVQAVQDERAPYAARVIRHGERPSAGPPLGVETDVYYVPVLTAREAAIEWHSFAIRGDCLRGTIEDGDEVLVEPVSDARKLQAGKIVIVSHGSELLCKRVAKVNGQVLLVADDGTAFTPDETTRIEGVVRKIIKSAP